MRRMQVVVGIIGLKLMLKVSSAFAAGSAPWDTQMDTVWQSITGGPFAALVLGAGIIGLGMALMASEHGSLWRGMPAFVLGGALVAGSQEVIPSFFEFGGGLVIPL